MPPAEALGLSLIVQDLRQGSISKDVPASRTAGSRHEALSPGNDAGIAGRSTGNHLCDRWDAGRADALAARFGLESGRPVDTFSGGEKRKVAIPHIHEITHEIARVRKGAQRALQWL